MKTTLDLSKLFTVSNFARKYKTSRKRVYSLLADRMLDNVTISGVIFIDTSDKAVLDNALLSSGRAVSDYTASKKPKISDNDTFDNQLDRDFAAWEAEHT